MSTEYIYDRAVIKTPTGYTLTLLLGDSNVWDDRRKRSRHWYAPLVNVPEEKAYDYGKRTSSSYFMWNGRMVQGESVVRWHKKAMKEALTVEEITALSRRSLLCYLEWYDGSERKFEDWAYISSTDRYLEWLEATEKKIKNHEPGITYTRHIGFDGDKPLDLPRNASVGGGRTIVKCKDAYVKTYDLRADTTRAISMTSDIMQAHIFPTRQEAVEACSPFRHITYVDADAALKRAEKKTYVLCFTAYSPVKYAQKRGKKRWYIVSSLRDAKRYTQKEAERAAEKACAAGHVVTAIPIQSEREG